MSETPEEELKRLVKEQAQDAAQGEVQHPEPGAVLRFEDYQEALNSQGEVVQGGRDAIARANNWFCKIHGTENMVRARPSWKNRGIDYECRECNRQNRRNYRALKKPWKREDYKQSTREAVRRYRAKP